MKTKLVLAAMLSVFSFATIEAAPAKKDNEVKIMVKENASEESKLKAIELQSRLDKLQAVDYNALSAEEQKNYRNELKSIKSEVRNDPGVYLYLGGGALILILLLLLLL